MAEGNGSAMPQLETLAQYVKDFSFENPNAPRSLAPRQSAPNISVNVNVNAREIAQGEIEVDLSIDGKAGEGDDLVFNFELVYSGIFRFQNVPQEHMHQIVMIECPRQLFPFARAIIANGVRDGGFPPFMLQPIDFASLYAARIADLEKQESKGNA